MAKKQQQETIQNDNSSEGLKKELQIKEDIKNNKGKYLFKCVKIQYRKNEQGYVMVPREGDKPKKLDPMKLHIELIDKKNTGLTAAIDEEDINLNNSQSLNSGIFLVKVDDYKKIKFE